MYSEDHDDMVPLQSAHVTVIFGDYSGVDTRLWDCPESPIPRSLRGKVTYNGQDYWGTKCYATNGTAAGRKPWQSQRDWEGLFMNLYNNKWAHAEPDTVLLTDNIRWNSFTFRELNIQKLQLSNHHSEGATIGRVDGRAEFVSRASFTADPRWSVDGWQQASFENANYWDQTPYLWSTGWGSWPNFSTPSYWNYNDEP